MVSLLVVLTRQPPAPTASESSATAALEKSIAEIDIGLEELATIAATGVPDHPDDHDLAHRGRQALQNAGYVSHAIDWQKKLAEELPEHQEANYNTLATISFGRGTAPGSEAYRDVDRVRRSLGVTTGNIPVKLAVKIKTIEDRLALDRRTAAAREGLPDGFRSQFWAITLRKVLDKGTLCRSERGIRRSVCRTASPARTLLFEPVGAGDLRRE